jgi:hypothetical protein
MPGIATFSRSRIAQRLELKLFGRKAHLRAVAKQDVSVYRDKVSHRATEPYMAVKPQSALHRMDHPVTAGREFAVFRLSH